MLKQSVCSRPTGHVAFVVRAQLPACVVAVTEIVSGVSRVTVLRGRRQSW
jgi:hypothetical protein